MMNQSASATRRPSGSTATAGCCPMFHHPFFVNTFSTQAPLIPPPSANQRCQMASQASQLQQIAQVRRAPSQVSQPNPTATNQFVSSTNTMSNDRQNQAPQQQQPIPPSHQHQAPRPQDNSNFNTSITGPSLPLHVLASRHSASSCMALAAALASASFPHFQQLQQQQHHQAPINHSQPPSSTTSNTTNSVPPSNQLTSNNNLTNTTATDTNNSSSNQVPLNFNLNFNSYNVAQSFLNMPAPAPLAAHLNISNTSNSMASNAPAATPLASAITGNQHISNQHPNHHQRPLATNTTLNSVANQQQSADNNYRNASQSIPQQPAGTPQMAPSSRIIQSDEAMNIFNESVQAILLNHLIGNYQFPPPISVPAATLNTTASHISPPPPSSGMPVPLSPPQVVIPPAQTGPIVPQQQQQHVEPTTVDQTQQAQQQFQQQQPIRMSQVPQLDSFSSSATQQPAANMYQQQQQQQPQLQHQHHTSSGIHQTQESVPQQQNIPQAQTQQQPQPIPPMPFYPFPMEQALAFLSNPQLANNLLGVMSLYLQNGSPRTESHHPHHHHHHQTHHFHHHVHGSHHHHHHHGPNGQGNGQDVTMPLDSLAISESKPRGLNRSEIDSLTPYILMNEKDIDDDSCVICLSKFELKSKIRPLSCNHTFHAKCVDKWLRSNRTCPLCRRDALKTYGTSKIKRI